MASALSQKTQINALSSLESQICDLRQMADLASEYISRICDRKPGDDRLIKVHPSETELTAFCVYHLVKLSSELEVRFYAALEGKGDSDATS